MAKHNAQNQSAENMTSAPKFRAILIAGPTASGKSGLALKLAQQFKGSIINADSMQVYAQMQVLTARPSAEEMADIPHHLYGHVSANHAYSVGQWLDDALAAIALCEREGRIPILVGGTGLYFKALTEGLANIPDIDDEIRQSVRAEIETKSAAQLHAALADFDKAAYERILPSDTQRILRAHEVFKATGRALSEWQNDKVAPMLEGLMAKILLMPDRDWLYQRCDARFAQMIEAGALEEATIMQKMDLSSDLPATKALGLAELQAYLTGEIDLELAKEQASRQTRRYAKRQMTWFRNQMITWNCFNEQDYYKKQQKIFSFLTNLS